MRRSASLALLCLAASLAMCQAVRLGGWGSPMFTEGDGLDMIKSKLLRTAGKTKSARTEASVGKRDSVDDFLERPGLVAIRYRVPPSMHEKFMDEWNNLYKNVDKKEDRKTIYTLSKSIQDNLYFSTYGEWETTADYIDHFHSGHVRDFLDFLEDEDITWELYPLKNVTSIEKEVRKMRDHDSENKRGKKDKEPVRIVFVYHAEPSVKDDFIDAWEDMAKSVWKEEGNAVFSLRKIGTNNHHFLGYGSWDSWECFMDHVASKHVKEFRDFTYKHDIVYSFEPVMRVHGDGDE